MSAYEDLLRQRQEIEQRIKEARKAEIAGAVAEVRVGGEEDAHGGASRRKGHPRGLRGQAGMTASPTWTVWLE